METYKEKRPLITSAAVVGLLLPFIAFTAYRLGNINSKLEHIIDILTPSYNLKTSHTETFGAEKQERRYIDVVVDGKSVKAYFEIDGQPAQDYFNNQK